MSWTYTPSATPSSKDVVRDLVQDIDTTDQLISDEAIGKYLTGGSLAQSNIYLAAVMVAGEIRRQFARRASSLTTGGSTASWASRAKDYAEIERDLRLVAARSGGMAGPYVGGASIAARDAIEADSDRVAPAFTRTTGEYPGTGPAFRSTDDW